MQRKRVIPHKNQIKCKKNVKYFLTTIEANESYWKESSLVLNHWKWWKYSGIFRLENRKIFRDVLNMPRRDHKWKTEPYYIECRSGWELSWILATRVSESGRWFGMLAVIFIQSLSICRICVCRTKQTMERKHREYFSHFTEWI